jgi:TolB protein
MTPTPRLSFLTAALAAVTALAPIGAGQAPPQPAPPPQQPSEIQLSISGEAGAPPRFAVPDFLAAGGDAETQAAAKAIAQVLWDDLDFEREFYLIPRDTYASVPAARSLQDVPFDRWRELGADGVVAGTVQRSGPNVVVQVRLFNVKSQQSVFAKEYSGPLSNPRLYAHTIADEIHQQQRGLRGVARTKLAFSSDRDGGRVPGPVERRAIKEVYVADYDGANQRRVTVTQSLNIFPIWSADGRSLAYTSYRRNNVPDIYVSHIYQGTPPETPLKGVGHNYLAAWSPDGTRIAFTSNRDGNPEIYVVNRDGSGVRRITSHPAIDITPTWSPAGNEIAFTSDRSGKPQIYIVSADGLGSPRRISVEGYADRATWAPAPYNEIAYAASGGGARYDIAIYEVATGERRQVTFEGNNQSPAFAPNGRHLAFTSTRKGDVQVFTIGRDGRGLRQVTTLGSNYTPNWSR